MRVLLFTVMLIAATAAIGKKDAAGLTVHSATMQHLKSIQQGFNGVRQAFATLGRVAHMTAEANLKQRVMRTLQRESAAGEIKLSDGKEGRKAEIASSGSGSEEMSIYSIMAAAPKCVQPLVTQLKASGWLTKDGVKDDDDDGGQNTMKTISALPDSVFASLCGGCAGDIVSYAKEVVQDILTEMEQKKDDGSDAEDQKKDFAKAKEMMNAIPWGTVQRGFKIFCQKDNKGDYCTKKVMGIEELLSNGFSDVKSLAKEEVLEVLCGPCLRKMFSGALLLVGQGKKEMMPKLSAEMQAEMTDGLGEMEDGVKDMKNEMEVGLRMVCMRAKGKYCLPQMVTMMPSKISDQDPASDAAAMVEMMSRNKGIAGLCKNGCLRKFISGAVAATDMKKEGKSNNNVARDGIKYLCMPDPNASEGGPTTCVEAVQAKVDAMEKSGDCNFDADDWCGTAKPNCKGSIKKAVESVGCCIGAYWKSFSTATQYTSYTSKLLKCGHAVPALCTLQAGKKKAKVQKRLTLDCDYAKKNWQKLSPKITDDYASNMGVDKSFINIEYAGCGSTMVDVEIQGYNDADTDNLATQLTDASEDEIYMQSTEETVTDQGGASMYAPPGLLGAGMLSVCLIAILGSLVVILF